MNLQEEIAMVARELYEKSGRVEGRDRENWLDAEKIVFARHAGQDFEEPEGEEAIISGEVITEEIEGTEPGHANEEMEGETADTEEIESKTPIAGKREKGSRRSEPAKKMATEKRGGTKKKTIAKVKKQTPKKTA
jgi:hypothetical protein